MPTSRSRRAPFSRRGEQAIQAFQEAAVADAMPRTEVGDDAVYAANARGARGHARQSLQPAHPVAVRAGEAVTWENQADERDAGDHAWLIETLEHPTSISVGASGQRMSAALAADMRWSPPSTPQPVPRPPIRSKRCCVTNWRRSISPPCASWSRARPRGSRPVKWPG